MEIDMLVSIIGMGTLAICAIGMLVIESGILDQLTSNQKVQIIVVYLVRSIMENKLAVLLEVLLADRPLSDEMMELVDEAIDYCIEKRYI